MSAFTHEVQEDADATTRLLADHVVLGRDQEHRIHHLDRAAGAVHVVDPVTGARPHAVDLTDHASPSVRTLGDGIAEWLAGVEAEWGWAVQEVHSFWREF